MTEQDAHFRAAADFFQKTALIAKSMPVSGLPVAAEITLDALLQKNVVSSWKITGDRNNSTVFILRLTAQSSDMNSQPLGLRTVRYRKKPPSPVLRDERRAEERIAAMKHQQPQMNNGQQQGHKQASEFRENSVEFLPTADKESQPSKNTESSQHSLLEDRQARANNGDFSDCVDMTSKCESVSVPIETVLGLSDTNTRQIKTSENFDYLSEASVTERKTNRMIQVSVLVMNIATIQMTGDTQCFTKS